MKLRDGMLWMALAVAGLAGCAVCDTCDDFPAPCVGPNCGHNGLSAYGNGGPAVMGSATPGYAPADDSAGPGPSMPPVSAMPATPAVDPNTPPASMEVAPK